MLSLSTEQMIIRLREQHLTSVLPEVGALVEEIHSDLPETSQQTRHLFSIKPRLLILTNCGHLYW